MKKALFFLILLLTVAGCVGTDNSTQNQTSTPKPDNVVAQNSPKEGDVVNINYIMKVGDRVVDTTYEEVAEKSRDPEDIRATHPFGFESLSFIVGSPYINPEFSKAVKEMEPGEKTFITLPPEKSPFGNRRESRIQLLPRFTTIPREEKVPTSLFQPAFGQDPEVGLEVPYEYWNSTVVEVNNDTTTLKHNALNGSNLEFPGGNISILLNETSIIMEFIPKLNDPFRTAEGGFVTIIASNESHMTVDYNHPLAGETLEVEMTLEKVSEPIQWNTNFDEALTISDQTGKPIFMLFTNASCVTCRRIEFETLSHPIPLALKDSFIWVKINVEEEKELIEHYDVRELPLILFIKEGKETNRVSTFLPPNALRVEMEESLASN